MAVLRHCDTMIKHPRAQQEWAEVYAETTVNGAGIGNLLSETLSLQIYPSNFLKQPSHPVDDDEFVNNTDNLALLCERLQNTRHDKELI